VCRPTQWTLVATIPLDTFIDDTVVNVAAAAAVEEFCARR